MRRTFLTQAVALVVLVCFTGCNLSFTPSTKPTYIDGTIKTVVSRVIDEQMDYVKPNLEPQLQSDIDSLAVKGDPSRGKEIVQRILTENQGADYVDFCYTVQESGFSGDSEFVLESARSIIPDDEYENLTKNVKAITKSFEDWGEYQVKGLPVEQQEPFFNDLKVLVTRTVVLLTAGVVYAVMPTTVYWGKVSAASAISVSSGLVALACMTLYQNYRFEGESGLKDGTTIEQWLKELVKIPEADFAMTTAVVSLGTTLGQGTVVKGIMICVFGILQAMDLINAMLRKYDFTV